MTMARAWFGGPGRVSSVVLVSAALVVVTLFGQQFAARVDTVLEDNWRGAYDILVTAPGQDFGAAATESLVDPNFVSTAGAGGISTRQLAEIREVDGVAVAAPVGLVGSLRDVGLSPAIWVEAVPGALPEGAADGAEVLYARLTMTVTTDHGAIAGEELARHVGYVAFRPSSADPSRDILLGDPVTLGTPVGFSPVSLSLGSYVPLGQLPALGSSVVAVDPAAEAELLGGERGAFLDVLRQAPAERDLTRRAWSPLVDPDRYVVPQGALFDAEGGQAGARATAVPLVVREAAPTPGLGLAVAIDLAVADDLPAFPESEAELDRLVGQLQFVPWREVSRDVSGLAAPFSTPQLVVSWPGSQIPEGEGAVAFSIPATELEPVLVGRPQLDVAELAADPASPTFEVRPRGVVGPDGREPDSAAAAGSGADPQAGLAQAYRSPTSTGGAGSAGALLAPLGSFDAADLVDADRDDASYVPTGLEAAAARMLTVDPAASSVGVQPGDEVSPNLTGVDFLTAAPGAFTDLAGGRALRGETPIDAVRVRVAGIETYDSASQARVTQVAADLSRLGLEARVVAGSSPQPVALFVPDYVVAADGGTSALGLVGQDWTTLGAVVTVESALSRTTVVLLLGVVGAVALGVVVTGLLAARGRRTDVVVLHRLGWRRRRIAGQLALSEAPGVIVVVALAAVLLPVASPLVRPSLGVLALLVATVAAASIPLSFPAPTRQRHRRHRWRRWRSAPGASDRVASSTGALARRHVRAGGIATVLTLLGVAGLAFIAGVSTAAVTELLQEAGATRLAAESRQTVTALVVAAGATGVVAAALLLSVARRIERSQRRRRDSAYARAGFSPEMRRRVVRQENRLLAIAAASAAAVIAAGFGLVGQPLPAAVCLVATVIALAGRFALQRTPTREVLV